MRSDSRRTCFLSLRPAATILRSFQRISYRRKSGRKATPVSQAVFSLPPSPSRIFPAYGTPSGVHLSPIPIPACHLPLVGLCRVNITRPLRGRHRAKRQERNRAIHCAERTDIKRTRRLRSYDTPRGEDRAKTKKKSGYTLRGEDEHKVEEETAIMRYYARRRPRSGRDM